MEIIKLGTTVFLINKDFLKLTVIPSRLFPAKVVGYQAISGKVWPILKAGRNEINPTNHHIFVDSMEGIKLLKNKKH